MPVTALSVVQETMLNSKYTNEMEVITEEDNPSNTHTILNMRQRRVSLPWEKFYIRKKVYKSNKGNSLKITF